MYYMGLNYDIKVRKLYEEEGGGWFAEFPLLPGCMSEGDTIEELLRNLEDANRAWIESCPERGQPVPEPSDEQYSGLFRIRILKSLRKKLAEKAREENVSLNQYVVHRLAQSVGQQ